MTVEPIRLKSKVKEMTEALREQSPRNALLFKFGINSILRIGDLLQIRYEDVIDENGNIRTYLDRQEQKTNKHKRIKINKVLSKEILAYVNVYNLKANDYLFFSFKNPSISIDRTVAWRFLKATAQGLGIENFGTHSMRKTMAYHVYKGTNNISLVMKMLNHSSPQVTMKYIGIDQETIDVAYEDFCL